MSIIIIDGIVAAACGHTVSARSLRDPQKQPLQKSLIGIDFRGEGLRKSAPIERIFVFCFRRAWEACAERLSRRRMDQL
jgi:hypothetical protein